MEDLQSEDRYSADAAEVVQAATGAWEARGAREKFDDIRYKGTPDRRRQRRARACVGK
jgi:hypothetical protein